MACTVLRSPALFAILLVAGLGWAPSARGQGSERDGTFPPGEGLILSDGSVVPGSVEELEDGRLKVSREGGKTAVHPRRSVALAWRAEKVLHTGEDAGVCRAWRRHITPIVVETHKTLYKRFIKARLFSDCRKVLDQVEAWGLWSGAKRLRKIASRSDRDGASDVRRRLAPELAEIRAPMVGAFQEAAAWCSKQGLPRAAAALLRDAMRFAPDAEGPLARLGELIPTGFPRRDAADAVSRWQRWAVVLDPIGAHWVAPDNPIRGSVTSRPWNRPDTLVIKTRNMLLFSRSSDPEIVGTCLRNGEAAIDAIEALFGYSHRKTKGDRWDFLEVRLHRNQAEYRVELKRSKSGDEPLHRSLGCYSPMEGVSRFFVPEATRERPVLAEMSETLAHELTHHYVAMRWRMKERRGRRSDLTPGFWCSEGIAMFVGGQAAAFLRRGKFDDLREESLYLAARLERKSALIPMRQLLGMGSKSFRALPPKPVRKIPRRDNPRILSLLGPSSVFYNQASALTFFLLNRRGAEGRRLFSEYLHNFYEGKTARDGWRALGYRSAEALDRDFKAFLRTVP